MLTVLATGSGSPCLDLSNISSELCDSASHGVDLVVMEGMGRAIHTNYTAQFTVDSLKIAVFKNPHVAQVLGRELYDGIVLFNSSTIINE